MEKNLAIFANTDIHVPIGMEYDVVNDHRPLTLVFAKEKTEASIREAIFDRRTAVWFGNSLIGKEKFLAPLFEACIEQEPAAYLENLAIVKLTNRCSIDFFVENTGEYSFYNATRFLVFKAGQTTGLAIKTGKRLEKIDLSVSVRNLHTTPDDALATRLSFEVSGTIPDKKMLDQLGPK